MTFTRRRYLQCTGGSVLVTGLAGCTGTDADETPPGGNGSDDDTNETRPAGTGGPGVSIVSTDDKIDLSAQPSVEVVREAATEDHPPQIRTALTNTSDKAVRVGEGRKVHFEYVSDTEELLTLLPANGSEYPAEPDCWRLTDQIVTTEEYRTFEIEAGETSTRLVDLYATLDADGCLPVGEYRFETAISQVDEDTESNASATWGFSVSLE